MNTKNETSQSNPAHCPNPVRIALRKISAVTLALLGIGFILWLDSWFMNHSDIPKFSRDMSYGLLMLIGFFDQPAFGKFDA